MNVSNYSKMNLRETLKRFAKVITLSVSVLHYQLSHVITLYVHALLRYQLAKFITLLVKFITLSVKYYIISKCYYIIS